MRRKTEVVHVRLSNRARALLDALAKQQDMTLTMVVEMALREKAEREGVKIPAEEQTDDTRKA